jgi:hypothetical protein
MAFPVGGISISNLVVNAPGETLKVLPDVVVTIPDVLDIEVVVATSEGFHVEAFGSAFVTAIVHIKDYVLCGDCLDGSHVAEVEGIVLSGIADFEDLDAGDFSAAVLGMDFDLFSWRDKEGVGIRTVIHLDDFHDFVS